MQNRPRDTVIEFQFDERACGVTPTSECFSSNELVPVRVPMVDSLQEDLVASFTRLRVELAVALESPLATLVDAVVFSGREASVEPLVSTH